MTELIIDIATRKEYSIDARKNGENIDHCPICSATRKNKKAKPFSYNAAKETGYCQNCEAKFVKKQDRPVVEKKIYDRPVWTNVTALSENLAKWFKGRGISQQTLIDNKITEGKVFMPQIDREVNAINFNYFRDSELINVKYRDGAKNFRLAKNAELIFYGLDDIAGKTECVITEGEMDKLSYHEIGITNVVSVPNGAAKGALKLEFLDNCWEAFEKMEKIYLATDDDEAGRILQDELARRLGKERCYQVNFFGCKDANELLQKDRLKLAETIQKSNEYPIEGVYTAKDFEAKIWDLKRNGLKPAKNIGIASCDKQLTFEEGYVTLVTGIPGHGKSEFTDQIIISLNIMHGWKAAYFSPENWPLELHHSKISTKLTGGDFNTEPDENTAAAIVYCKDNFYMIYPEQDFSLESILTTAKQLVKKYGIRSLVIDAWNKLEHLYTGNESQYISKELDKLDFFAKRHGVHVFLIAHPTKMQKDEDGINYKVPDGYSVSGSASFFSKPANIICVYRRYAEDNTSSVEIYYQKVKFRHWGEGRGSAMLRYNGLNGRYHDREPNNKNLLAPLQQEMVFKTDGTINTYRPISSQEVKEKTENIYFDSDEDKPEEILEDPPF